MTPERRAQAAAQFAGPRERGAIRHRSEAARRVSLGSPARAALALAGRGRPLTTSKATFDDPALTGSSCPIPAIAAVAEDRRGGVDK
jgi:hypothetical protein